uniref:Uncharacterized protein n=1 Tax=Coccolithus braarudii TaxID=221442 RepID=A0A7S0L967_9EUKA|mmetsp:Transcript_22079/g.47601  ORF Transcript_22079/g.47601 Transcript_22079/m.47601 type:complete len:207 (+) Transcript_22079:598-1218(+)
MAATAGEFTTASVTASMTCCIILAARRVRRAIGEKVIPFDVVDGKHFFPACCCGACSFGLDAACVPPSPPLTSPSTVHDSATSGDASALKGFEVGRPFHGDCSSWGDWSSPFVSETVGTALFSYNPVPLAAFVRAGFDILSKREVRRLEMPFFDTASGFEITRAASVVGTAVCAGHSTYMPQAGSSIGACVRGFECCGMEREGGFV